MLAFWKYVCRSKQKLAIVLHHYNFWTTGSADESEKACMLWQTCLCSPFLTDFLHAGSKYRQSIIWGSLCHTAIVLTSKDSVAQKHMLQFSCWNNVGSTFTTFTTLWCNPVSLPITLWMMQNLNCREKHLMNEPTGILYLGWLISLAQA